MSHCICRNFHIGLSSPTGCSNGYYHTYIKLLIHVLNACQSAISMSLATYSTPVIAASAISKNLLVIVSIVLGQTIADSTNTARPGCRSASPPSQPPKLILLTQVKYHRTHAGQPHPPGHSSTPQSPASLYEMLLQRRLAMPVLHTALRCAKWWMRNGQVQSSSSKAP